MIDYKKKPKADLHVHLNGLVSNHVFKKLLQPYKGELPEWFNIDNDMTLNRNVSSLTEYLKPWYGFKLLPRNEKEFEIMVNSAIENLSLDNVVYAEIRNSPFNIASLFSSNLENVLNLLCDKFQESSEIYKIDARLIVSLSRYKLTFEKAHALFDAIKKVNRPDIIVGIDISGNEDEAIDNSIANLVKKAKDNIGIGVTIHAGETGKIENIEWAINECNADRISHACALPMDSKLAETIVEKDICVECCIFSNIFSGAVFKADRHPVKYFLDNQIPFVICSDNPSVHNKTLTDEYNLFIELTKNSNYLEKMFSVAKDYSFGG
ncbi:hypothetical protein QA601_03715 [Chitinispirillales bacterium ANBcel5]|uniref:adenosine deaminase n=1 Tax=Cellulosispirillum alkaliphilum TaxID=3039283 RepID=UPI002A557AD1|nr:hypothetical protein [Chitinispirillales bacterium ANBcel5]